MTSIRIHIDKTIKSCAYFTLFILLTFHTNELLAQEATLRIQKNIVERIDRLDKFIRDTIDPELMKKNQSAWNDINSIKDSLLSTSDFLREWSAYQDSTSTLLNVQQSQIQNQQRMINALNWQVKEALRTKGDVQQELGTQIGQNAQLEKENLNLKTQIKDQNEQIRSLNNKLLEQQDILKKLLEVVQSNNRYLQPKVIDSLQTMPIDSTRN